MTTYDEYYYDEESEREYVYYDDEMNVNTNGTVKYCFPPLELSWFTYGCTGVGGFLCLLLGVSGSIFCLNHLSKRTAKTRMVKFLMNLCFWDMALLITTFGFYGLVVLVHKGEMRGKLVYFYIVCYPLLNVAMSGSLWLALLISYERYVAVTYPLLQRIREGTSVRYICLFVLIGSILVNLPTAFELSVGYCNDKHLDAVDQRLILSSLRQNTTYLFVYRILIYMTFNGGGPFVAVLVLTILTLIKRHMAFRIRKTLKETVANGVYENGNQSSRESRTTVLLTALIVKFLICHTGPTVLNVAEFVEPDLLKDIFFEQMADLSNFLVIFHSATNWLLFCRWRNQRSRVISQKVSSAKLTIEDMERFRSLWRKKIRNSFNRKVSIFSMTSTVVNEEPNSVTKITRKYSELNLNIPHEQSPLLHKRSLQNLNAPENESVEELSYKIELAVTEILFQKGTLTGEQLKSAWQKQETLLTNGKVGKEQLVGHLLLKNLLTASESVKERDLAFKFAATLMGTCTCDSELYEKRKMTTSTMGISQV